MSTVVMHNVASVDGFIADADDQTGCCTCATESAASVPVYGTVNT
jgi:hypothetical protein